MGSVSRKRLALEVTLAKVVRVMAIALQIAASKDSATLIAPCVPVDHQLDLSVILTQTVTQIVATHSHARLLTLVLQTVVSVRRA